jgi:hypothetical protein
MRLQVYLPNDSVKTDNNPNQKLKLRVCGSSRTVTEQQPSGRLSSTFLGINKERRIVVHKH